LPGDEARPHRDRDRSEGAVVSIWGARRLRMSARESPLAAPSSPAAGGARRLRNYVGGEWVEPSCEWLDDVNPATGELIGMVPRSGPADVDAAVAAARAAQPAWRAVAVQRRARAVM